MAKASIRTGSGVIIQVEGTPAEIAAVVRDVKRQEQQEAARRAATGKTGRVRLVDLIDSLVDGGFFKKLQDLPAIKLALEEMGHHYPLTTLSGAMLTQVRKRKLRRLRKDNRWMYTR